MTWDSKVVWSEGMFLRSQHFQQADRYVEHLVRARTVGVTIYPWGFSELVVNRELLATGKFALARARGVLPDGTPFDIPDHDPPPPPLDLPDNARNCVVYLAVPVRQPGGIEFDASDNGVSRFGVTEVDVDDAIADGSTTAKVRIGRLRLRYLLDTQDRIGWHCLGAARLVEVRADRNAVLDDAYIPSCLDCRASVVLAGYMAEIQGLLHHRGEAVAARVVGSGATKGVAEIADFLMLQALNRYEPQVAHMAQLADLHPERFYAWALGLAGELDTFTARGRRPPAFPPYIHDDLQRCFDPVIADIRQSLSAVLEQSAIEIPLQERKYGIRVGVIADRTLIGKATFVLAVKADVPSESLRRNLPSLIKIGPVEQIRELVNVALPGIRVRNLPVAPRQIPYHAGSCYFELEQQSPLWKQMETSGGIALHLAGDFPGVEIALWAIKE